MTEPKTVSNLPLDVSIRWAEDQKRLEETQPIVGRDAAFASNQAQTETILPFKPSDFDQLFGLAQLHPSWATFEQPPGFLFLRRRIFRSQLMPFLGSDEQQEALMSRIQHVGEDKDKQEQERLINLLQLLQRLNKDLIDISTRCKQYQKG